MFDKLKKWLGNTELALFLEKEFADVNLKYETLKDSTDARLSALEGHAAHESQAEVPTPQPDPPQASAE